MYTLARLAGSAQSLQEGDHRIGNWVKRLAPNYLASAKNIRVSIELRTSMNMKICMESHYSVFIFSLESQGSRLIWHTCCFFLNRRFGNEVSKSKPESISLSQDAVFQGLIMTGHDRSWIHIGQGTRGEGRVAQWAGFCGAVHSPPGSTLPLLLLMSTCSILIILCRHTDL